MTMGKARVSEKKVASKEIEVNAMQPGKLAATSDQVITVTGTQRTQGKNREG